MEELKLRYQAMQQALLTLQEGLTAIEVDNIHHPEVYKLMRDGVIQRFEYCIDLFWKFFKLYLEKVGNVAIESPSPKNILKKISYLNFITQDEYNILIDSVTDRNLTSHTYDENTAQKIQNHLPIYHLTMKTIIDRLDIQNL